MKIFVLITMVSFISATVNTACFSEENDWDILQKHFNTLRMENICDQETHETARKQVAIAEKEFGLNDMRMVISLNNVADTICDEKDFPEVESALKKVVDIDKKLFGSDHPNLGLALAKLGNLYYITERTQEAESLLRQSLDLLTRNPAPDPFYEEQTCSLNICFIRSSVVIIAYVNGHATELELSFVDALKRKEKTLGSNHIELIPYLYNLAAIFECGTKHSEAEALYKRISKIEESALGPYYPDLLLINICFWNREMNRKKIHDRYPYFKPQELV